MKPFRYAPATFIPFQDLAAVERARRIKKGAMTKHPNSKLHIRIVPDADVEFLWIADMFHRIQEAATAGRRMVMIMPNPWPSYAKVAHLINQAGISCRHLHTFNIMDEYANEQGDIAPETWRFGFGYAFKKYFWSAIEPKLRPPERQVHLLSDKTIKDYGKMLADLGGADICCAAPGWTGHLAFIEPDAPEFAGSLAEWKQMGPRVCTLSPLTIAQNSLHGSFGASGDVWAVPPKAATIGPAEVIGSKNRLDMHAIALGGTFISWQRLMTRLVLHGPVTPRLPTSIIQTLPAEVLVSESAAADIEPRWEIGY